jgi:hypothetical protein
MNLIQRLDNVHACLLENSLTIPMYIRGVLSPKMFRAVTMMMIPLLLKSSGIQNVKVFPDPVGESLFALAVLGQHWLGRYMVGY